MPGVTQVRSSFFTDDNREATRLVFDLEEEIPYQIIDDGEGKVRVRFGAEDASRPLTDVRGEAAADWLDGVGLENLELLAGPLEATLLDQGETEVTLLSDLEQSGEAAIVSLFDDEETVEAEIGTEEIPEDVVEKPEAIELDNETNETEIILARTSDEGEENDQILAAFETEETERVLEATPTAEIAQLLEAEQLEEPEVSEDFENDLPGRIANPIFTLEEETRAAEESFLALASTELTVVFPTARTLQPIVVEELESEASAEVDPLRALAQPETTVVSPVSNAETVPPAGPIAAAPPSAFFAQAAVQALETPQYTGEIVTLDFRDLDLQDFFRLIGDISGLNVVLDPAVNGTVTLLLRDVPWDQVLDLVLRNNNLGYELQGNILRVATRATLQAEEDAARALREAQELNAQLVTQTFILSYTQSDTVSGVVQGLLSARGSIITDARRNALIVTDIPSQFGRVESLVSFLDTPSQQVEIEARLLSASKSFSRDLGTQIGLLVGNNSQNAVTGLPGSGSPFARTPAPSVNVGGAVPLISDFPAGGTSGLSFLLGAGGDILLDTIIQAAEATGTAKLLSRPRITTQNNQAATVSQGTQIPVQTNVNNTISVTFVDFSLSLTVTPQITEAGTILLTAAIENSSSEFGRSVNGIPSVSSQQATTQVLIPDGGTAVIGGILLDNDSINISQVPGLGNIPVLGNLFKSTQVIKSTSELLFFITARIKPANPLEFLSETAAEESSQLFAQ